MAQTALTKPPKVLPSLVHEELARIEADLGGRRHLVGLLTLAPLTDDLRYLLGVLGEPRHDKHSLATLCARANILPGELIRHLGDAALLRGKTLALQKIGNGIAAVAEDVMRRAATYTETCNVCLGTGSLTPAPTPAQPNPTPGPCETCKGLGALAFYPDLDRQKLAVDMAQLLPKGGGVNIAVQQNNLGGKGGGMGALERMQLLTDKILYGTDAPEEAAEAVEPAEAPVTAAAPVEGELVPPAAEPPPTP